MPQSIITAQFDANVCLPLYGGTEGGTLELPINLAPATNFPAWTLLGEITGTANDVQTFTATGTPTGGSFTFTVTNPLTGLASSLVIPYNATSTSLLALAVAIFGTGNVTAGGGAWPGTPLTLTGAGQLAGVPIPVAVAGTNSFTGGSSPTATVAHTTTGRAANTYAAYASGNSDGTQFPRCILKYTVTTDASGRISGGAGTTGATVANVAGLHGQSRPDTPAWFRGEFDATRILGLDANAVPLLGRLYSGVNATPKVIRLT